MDGTDCKIQQPTPSSKKWYSHKFKSAGLWWEVVVCIKTGDIVWIYGPFPCGKWPDIKIYRRRLKHMLRPGEMVEADAGYRDATVPLPNDHVSQSDRMAKEHARARHETVNKRLKQFRCLKNTFQHELQKQQYCFKAAAVCTQLMFENGHPPFSVRY